jgi:hypothetical protein
MSWKHIDLENAFRRLAERRIEDAMKEGKFDHLRGMGEPLELDDMPAQEDARLTWWALRILKNADFTPEEIRYRKSIDHLKARLAEAKTVERVMDLVKQVNDLVHRLNTLGTNAINSGVAPVCQDEELNKLRQRMAAP